MKKLIILLLIILTSTVRADFGGYIKADTESIFIMGPFVDVSDGYTPETGITLGAADEAYLIRAATTTATDISGATWAAVTNMDGYYALTLQTGWLDTEGPLNICIQDDNVFLPVKSTAMVVNANVFDSLFAAAATDYLQADLIQVAGDTTADGGDGLLDVNIKEVGDDDITDNGDGRLEVNVEEIGDNAVPCTTAQLVSDAPSLTGGSTIQVDASGYIKVSDGTGTGQLDTDSGTVLLRSATETQIDNIETDTAAMDTYAEMGALVWNHASTRALTELDEDNTTIDLDSTTVSASAAVEYELNNTTIAVLTTQTSFTLTAGSTDDDAYNYCIIIIEDASTATQKAIGIVKDYTGSTKTVTLRKDPGVFTMAATDKVYIYANPFGWLIDLIEELGF